MARLHDEATIDIAIAYVRAVNTWKIALYDKGIFTDEEVSARHNFALAEKRLQRRIKANSTTRRNIGKT